MGRSSGESKGKRGKEDTGTEGRERMRGEQRKIK